MSYSSSVHKHKSTTNTNSEKTVKEKNNNNGRSKLSDLQQARNFMTWYENMVDNDRQNLPLYLSDEITFEWFGRTIKTRKKVSMFLKCDMQCSRHHITTVQNISKIQPREQPKDRNEDTVLASPLSGVSDNVSSSRKRVLRSTCSSPDWAADSKPVEDVVSKRKRKKLFHTETMDVHVTQENHDVEDTPTKDLADGVGNQGDVLLESTIHKRCVPVTPPHREVGQGDCVPSTSSTDLDKSLDTHSDHELPKLAVECNGYVEFMRTKNNRADGVKWERKCKVQISYSIDPLNLGEYIIWAIHYTDESKCRRNLLAAFEEAAKETQHKSPT